MKKSSLILSLLLVCSINLLAQGVAINNNGATPDSTAILDVTSGSKGLLIPRLTQQQRNNINSPANGLIVYQTDNDTGFYYRRGSRWKKLGGDELPSGAIVMSEILHDTAFENNGFSYIGYLNATKDTQTQSTTIPPNTWYALNQTDPGNATAPPCHKYFGSFWDGTNVIGVNYTSIYYYNPATDKYTYDALTPPAPNFSPPYYELNSVEKCGNYIVVMATISNLAQFNYVGYKLDLTTRIWSVISTSNIPAARLNAMYCAADTTLILWGGAAANGAYYSNGGIYNPATDTWTTIASTSPLSNIQGREGACAVWTGTQLIVWGGFRKASAVSSTTNCTGVNYTSYTYKNDGFRYTPATGIYGHISTNTITPRAHQRAVWTGTEMVIIGGYTGYEVVTAHQNTDNSTVPPTTYYTCDIDYPGSSFSNGVKFNSAINSWTPISANSKVSERSIPVWTGTDVAAIYPGNKYAALYNPASNTWSSTLYPDCTGGNFSNETDFYGQPVWAGDKLIVNLACNSGNINAYAISNNSVTLQTTTTPAPVVYYLYKKN